MIRNKKALTLSGIINCCAENGKQNWHWFHSGAPVEGVAPTEDVIPMQGGKSIRSQLSERGVVSIVSPFSSLLLVTFPLPLLIRHLFLIFFFSTYDVIKNVRDDMHCVVVGRDIDYSPTLVENTPKMLMNKERKGYGV